MDYGGRKREKKEKKEKKKKKKWECGKWDILMWKK